MILVLVLLLFTALTAFVFNAEVSTAGAEVSTSKVVEKEKAFLLLRSAMPLVEKLLDNYTNGGYVSLSDPWARPMSVNTPLGEVEVRVVDLDRFLNLNSVDKRGVKETFENLLGELEIDDELLERLLQWEGKKPYGGWGEYPPPGKGLASKYELLLIWNNTGDLYGKRVGGEELPGLLQLTTVHSGGRVNVNTAPVWILKALPGIDDATVEEIVELRRERVIKNLQQLLGVGSIDMNTLYRWSDVLTTQSRYFLVKMHLKGRATSTLLWFIYDIKTKTVVEQGVE